MKRQRTISGLIAVTVAAIVCLILIPPALRAIAGGDERRNPAPDKPFGIHVPCQVVDVIDGDTLTCRLVLDVSVRLLDCWAPELRAKTDGEKQKAHASKTHLESVCLHKTGGLFVSLDGADRLDDVLSFGRVLGRVWVHDVGDLSATQVSTGHAFRRKVDLQKALAP